MPAHGALTESDRALLAEADALLDGARAALAGFALHDYLAQVWRVVGAANRYFTAEEPWIKRKADPERMATVLYVTAEVLREVAILVQPVMPAAMGRLLDMLGAEAGARSFDSLGPEGRLRVGAALPPPAVIFPRYVEAEAPPAAGTGAGAAG